MDIFAPAKRAAIMAQIRSKDTAPERAVRSFLHGAGLRFRLHRVNLPGKPDIVLSRYKVAIFVHGCFWHQHEGCKKARLPQTRTDWWREKLTANKHRDETACARLTQMGWTPIVIWQCEISKPNHLGKVVEKILALKHGAVS